MVNALKRNFLIFPAIVLAAILYSGLVSFSRSRPFCGLVRSLDVQSLSGVVIDNPVKTSGPFPSYRFHLRLNSVSGKNGLVSTARGIAELYLPAPMYEVYQPGRLCSSFRGELLEGDGLIDQGANLILQTAPQNISGSENKNQMSVFKVLRVNSSVYKNTLSGRLFRFRALSRLHFARLMYGWSGAGGLLLALISGARAYLEKDAADAFRDAGLSHILALSGMHLSLFSGIAFLMGKKSLGKRIAPFLQLIAVLTFVWFAGRSPSLFRALLCSSALIIAAVFKLKNFSMLNILSLAFLIHISIFPQDMVEISFMLSYGALAGILCFNEFIARPLSHSLPYNFGASLAQSAGAQVFTIPLTLRFFGLFTPGGVIASSVLSPLVNLFIYSGLVLILLSILFPPVAVPSGTIVGVLYSIIKTLVLIFAKIPKVRIS